MRLKHPPEDATIDDYIEYFATAYGQQTGHNIAMMKNILSDAKSDPVAIWQYLKELCQKGKIVAPDFEVALGEFLWKFCY